MRAKLIGKHKEGCLAVLQTKDKYTRWDSPWCPIPEEKALFRAIDGTKKGRNVPWLVFRCNDSDCKAKIMVNGFDIVDAAEANKK